jgi:hypothetical protein
MVARLEAANYIGGDAGGGMADRISFLRKRLLFLPFPQVFADPCDDLFVLDLGASTFTGAQLVDLQGSLVRCLKGERYCLSSPSW